MIKYLSKFLYVLGRKRRSLAILTLLFLFTSLMETVGIGLVGPFIAMATNESFIEKEPLLYQVYAHFGYPGRNYFLVALGLLLISIFYIKSFLGFAVQKYIFDFGVRHQGDLATRLLRAYLAAPYTFHLSKNSAQLIHNMMVETARFTSQVLMPLLFSASNLVVIGCLVLLLIKTNLMATVIIGGVLVAAFGLFHLFRHRIAHWGKEGSQAGSEMLRITNHALGGLKETRVIGCGSFFEQQLQAQADRYAVAEGAFLGFSNLPRYMLEAFLITFLIGFTFIFLVSQQEDTQNLNSVLGIFAMASIRLLPAAGNVVSSLNSIRHSSYSLQKLYTDLKELEQLERESGTPLLSAQPGWKDSPVGVMPFNRQVNLKHVVYRYPETEEAALHGISLNVKRGESIGLIGRSGAGKTTLVDVLLGLLVPQSGDIQVDDTSIYSNLRAWQNLVGYIPQTIFLMDDTLEQNIAFGVPKERIDRARLESAIQAAQLAELVQDLPQGLQTQLGERGVRLSGGQRQRVGIARALYHDREILVLDEATAALDSETETLVSDAIRSLSGQKTLIVIAHRLTTLEGCDRIYRLEKGRLVDSGSYREIVLGERTVGA